MLQAKNEKVINASANNIWAIITDIRLLHKINPSVVRATGKMSQLGETRTCELISNGRKGTMTEKLVELIPERKTIWAIESDSIGLTKMLHNTRFVSILEKINDSQTRVINETYYQAATFPAKILNSLFMKKKISRAQEQILFNLKSLSENKIL